MESIITQILEKFTLGFLEAQKAFFDKPDQFANYVILLSDKLQTLGVDLVRYTLESYNDALCKSGKRKEKYYVEKHDNKQLVTSLGAVDFKKTLFSSKEKQDEMLYILDKIMGFDKHQRMSDDAVANVLKEAVQTSYRKGGENVNPTGDISKMAVKDLIHKLKFPVGYKVPVQKKIVDYLYIDADEDHAHLQFQEKKGDLEKDENGRKKNGIITKLIYVYEGVEPESPRSRRNKLIGTFYFSRVTNNNKALWDEVYSYIDATYDLSKVKKIYLNADGGEWIKGGMRYIHGIEYVLDEFHLSKYLMKMTRHMLDSQDDAADQLRSAIRSKTKEEFHEKVAELCGYAETEKIKNRIIEASDYILKNWTAAKTRLNRRGAICGCSAEGHVSHVLSSRMSTPPLGWSRKGAAQMARLREYYYNGGDFLELAEYQHKNKNEVRLSEKEKEEIILSANSIMVASRAGRSIYEMELGKYYDAMAATIYTQTKKQLSFYLCGKI